MLWDFDGILWDFIPMNGDFNGISLDYNRIYDCIPSGDVKTAIANGH